MMGYKPIDGNPETNYEVFLKLIEDVKDKCYPRKLWKITKRNTKIVNRWHLQY